MAKRKVIIPEYGTVMKKGVLYYRTRIKDANGKLVALYAKTPEELYIRKRMSLGRLRMPHSIGKRPRLRSIVRNGC